MVYEVGQVLYVVLRSQQTVIPVQVIEQILRRTLEGEQTTYTVNVPTSNAREPLKKMSLDDLDGNVYDSLDGVNGALLENAKAAIDGLISKANAVASKYFVVEKSIPVPLLPEAPEDRVQVTLEDGTVANVKVASAGSPS